MVSDTLQGCLVSSISHLSSGGGSGVGKQPETCGLYSLLLGFSVQARSSLVLFPLRLGDRTGQRAELKHT